MSKSTTLTSELVTVYIISYNRPQMLKNAIKSVVEQSYSNIEIIIADDASHNFNINQLSTEVNFKDRQKQIFRNSTNKGANYSRNLAIKNAKGKYITGLDDDDYFHPHRIEQMLTAYKRNKCCAVSTLSQYSNENSNNKIPKLKTAIKNLLIPNKSVSLNEIKVSNYLSNQILTETKKLNDIGGFDESFPSLQDYETWYRLIKMHGSALRLGKVLYFCKQLESSITQSSGKKLEGHKCFYNKHHKDFDEKDHQSFKISTEYKRFDKVSFSTLLHNLNTRNYKRVIYLFFFKSCFSLTSSKVVK